MSKNILYTILSFILISTVGAVIYSNSLAGPYIFDDFGFILRNSSIRDLSRVGEIWNIGSLSTRFVTFFSWALNYHFHEYRVFGYHLTDVVIHILNTFFVFLFFQLIVQTPRIKERNYKNSYLLCLFTALFFLAHPLQTQAVSYMTQRFALLATFFYISSLYFYLHARLIPKERVIKFLFSALLALAGMFTKEITFTLPFIILLVEIFLLKTNFRKMSVLLMVLFLFALIVPFLWSFNIGDVLLRSYESGSHVGDVVHIGNYYLTQFRVISVYLKLLVFPVGQSLDYDFPVSQSLFEPITTLGGFFLLAAIAYVGFRFYKIYPLISFGIFWFFITASVESSIIPIRNVIFEHRMYLPMIGVSFVIANVFGYVLKNPKKYISVMSVIILCLCVLTYQRNKIWQDDLLFWKDTAQKFPQKARVYTHIGNAYLEREEYLLAIKNYNISLELDPEQAGTYSNRGSAYLKTKEWDQALSNFNQALELEPGNFATFNNRGNLYMQLKKYDLAMADFNAALSINSYYAEAYVNRGMVFYRNNRLDDAIKEFDKALELNPSYAKGYFNRGSAYLKLKEYSQALKDLQKAAVLDANNRQIHNNLGVCYARLKQYQHSVDSFTRAVELDPRAYDLYQNRGSVYQQLGQLQKAIDDFSFAIQFNPEAGVAYFKRSKVYFEEKDFKKAFEDVLRAQNLGVNIPKDYVKELNNFIKTE